MYIKVFPLPDQISREEVEVVFEEYGEVESVLFSDEAQRVAYVKFTSEKSARRALAHDGEKLANQIVHVMLMDKNQGSQSKSVGFFRAFTQSLGFSRGSSPDVTSAHQPTLLTSAPSISITSTSTSTQSLSHSTKVRGADADNRTRSKSVSSKDGALPRSKSINNLSDAKEKRSSTGSAQLLSDGYAVSALTSPRVKRTHSESDTSEEEGELSEDASSENGDIADDNASGSESWQTRYLSSAKIAMEGFLTKEGAVRKSWRRRYFILTYNGYLRYYKTSGELSPIFTINLRGYTPQSCDFSEKERAYCFRVHHSSQRTFWMCAESDAERTRWLQTLEKVMTQLSAAAVTPSKGGKRLASIGRQITENDQQYELIYDMLFGIRHCVGLASAKAVEEVEPAHFHRFDSYAMGPNRSGKINSQYDFDFVDYAPVPFRALREIYNVDAVDYLVSLTGEYKLSELGTEGKSGSFFYFSKDQRFLFKTVTGGEFKTLRRMLPAYYTHMRDNADTLLVKLLGLHCVRRRGATFRFVVMANVFSRTLPMHERYDLKGSTLGRTAGAEQIKANPSTLRKDLDFERNLLLSPSMSARLRKQLRSDVAFLQKANIMDYSLVVGIHVLSDEAAENVETSNVRSRSVFERCLGGTRLAIQWQRLLSFRCLNATPHICKHW